MATYSNSFKSIKEKKNTKTCKTYFKGQNETNTKARDITGQENNNHLPDRYRCKISIKYQQPNPTQHENDFEPESNGIYYQETRIATICKSLNVEI